MKTERDLVQDQRPWGSYVVLDEADGHKVKRIHVNPGMRLSYQRHAHRAEHWVVVRGTGVVTLEGARTGLGVGEAIDIPLGAAHRIENPSGSELLFVEVQRGSYLGEDDITRISDDFGRAGRPV